MKTNYPFYDWIPKPIGVLILLALFVPLFFSGGTYLSNINEMAGGMGVLTENFQFLSLCASIGMSMVFPFMLPYLQARNVKHVYLGGYTLLALLNGVCAVTENIPVLMACCFLIGFIRVALVLNTTFVIAPYLLGIQTLDMFLYEPDSPEGAYKNDHARTILMPVLYCYILCIVQFSNYVSAWVAYEFRWELHLPAGHGHDARCHSAGVVYLLPCAHASVSFAVAIATRCPAADAGDGSILLHHGVRKDLRLVCPALDLRGLGGDACLRRGIPVALCRRKTEAGAGIGHLPLPLHVVRYRHFHPADADKQQHPLRYHLSQDVYSFRQLRERHRLLLGNTGLRGGTCLYADMRVSGGAFPLHLRRRLSVDAGCQSVYVFPLPDDGRV